MLRERPHDWQPAWCFCYLDDFGGREDVGVVECAGLHIDAAWEECFALVEEAGAAAWAE